jgi:hypothetical protein
MQDPHFHDWICSSCHGHVFGTKSTCLCGQTKLNTKQYKPNTYNWRIGDKCCSNCSTWNFKKNKNCIQCNLTFPSISASKTLKNKNKK